jgi:hypothetical protein
MPAMGLPVVSARQHYNITILNRQLQQVFEKLQVDN